MHAILHSRPEGFDSVEEGIDWQYMFDVVLPPAHTNLLSGWFPSLSSLFLGLRSARLLLLAGAERLYTTLMVDQMQGKFWLEVMAGSGVGHLVHEDDPMKLAEILADFWRRNERNVVRGNVIKAVGEV
ncbi:hypothetical protein C8R48DRAFT_777810 [Suillus tomentosus]|nr:hypothetical protein C8R48DRAFT_777810 [Suillus tomentosus]